MSENNWAEKLREEFHWSNDEPDPEQVVEEARKRNIESAEHLIERMKDAGGVPDNISETIEETLSEQGREDLLEILKDEGGTGYMRWSWYRNYRDSFLGGPSNKK